MFLTAEAAASAKAAAGSATAAAAASDASGSNPPPLRVDTVAVHLVGVVHDELLARRYLVAHE